MAQCDVCGNDYDKSFQVTVAQTTMTFDSFECAIHAVLTIALSCLLLVGPAVPILIWRDRWRARRFIPVCHSCGYEGARGTRRPSVCPECGGDPEQRRVVREIAKQQARRRRADIDDNEALRRVLLAKEYKDHTYLID